MRVELWQLPWPPSPQGREALPICGSAAGRDNPPAFGREVAPPACGWSPGDSAVHIGELLAPTRRSRTCRSRAPLDSATSRGPHGKPGPLLPDGPHWNLSHSGAHALLALSWDGPLGVDIQEVRDRPDPHRAAKRFLSAAEYDDVVTSADPARAYHRALCRKEAWVKADGGRLLDALRLPTPAEVVDLDAPPGYVAALAVTDGRTPRILRHSGKGTP
ncbi:hypothetical protein ABH931_000397 [Streptacidiphilus sp. MAP12-33]|uniref:4'-phosphopantetheinyl transferase family protein n=1 Tax=Streptacidiphilus sp. MAP12-33 TaxID=3156266 RepID=UPI00351503C6